MSLTISGAPFARTCVYIVVALGALIATQLVGRKLEVHTRTRRGLPFRLICRTHMVLSQVFTNAVYKEVNPLGD